MSTISILECAVLLYLLIGDAFWVFFILTWRNNPHAPKGVSQFCILLWPTLIYRVIALWVRAIKRGQR